ncbi:Holliday junction resolvase RuvX [Candidatus Woesebacteria bacterium]|nr:Holliday junction resolvase RuvX [Candidatus Woesebacteria bacterium]
MKYLGIDYGKRKIGLAISTEEKLATPYSVLKVSSEGKAIEKIRRILDEENLDRIVLGISEGKVAVETKDFASKLEKSLDIKVLFYDETLTTKDAQEMSIEAGIKRKKRRNMEDAYSATLILQGYLDSQ